MAIIREKDQGLSIPLAYSMYYIWGTRPLYGKYDYSFAFYPFRGNWQNADLPKRALEYAFPAPVCEMQGTSNEYGSLIKPFQFQFDNSDLMLTALYPQGNGIVARFFKYGDRSAQSTVNINRDTFNISEIDLNGNVLNSKVNELHLTPWQFKTVRIY